jgi:Na+/H+-dicarboxylate symporter
VPLVVFALILGVALVQGGERYATINRLMEELLDLSLKLVGWVMVLAPYGVAALLARLIATQDVALLGTMLTFVLVVLGTTLFHGVVVLPGLLWLIARVSPLALWRGGRESLITAFATSSSAATMPITLRVVEKNFGVRPATAGFVVPVGTTMNMDGTALYEAAAALFIANLVGIELSLGQQIVVCFMSMLAAVGAPGIPSAGMVTMAMVLQSVGLPVEAIAILLPIDRLLDAVRTTVNVEGDIVGSIVVEALNPPTADSMAVVHQQTLPTRT